MFRNLRQIGLRLGLFLYILVLTNFLFGQTKKKAVSVIFCGKIEQADVVSKELSFRFYKDFLTFEEITHSITL